jgi:hypothetical protein
MVAATLWALGARQWEGGARVACIRYRGGEAGPAARAPPPRAAPAAPARRAVIQRAFERAFE